LQLGPVHRRFLGRERLTVERVHLALPPTLRPLDADDGVNVGRRLPLPDAVTPVGLDLSPDVGRRWRRVAAVLVEPIQGEGGVRLASAPFMRKLRLLTRIYDVPLVFDEVQTGWGMTGRLWAHELFDLPCPPDLVTWAKKAQNGVLFVSEELATFFQEEKKFNTTWEGDSVGMVRLLALLDKLDLEQVRRTGDHARHGLEALAKDLGAREIDLPVGHLAAWEAHRVIMAADMAHNLGAIVDKGGETSKQLRDLVAEGREVTAVQYLAAVRDARKVAEQLWTFPSPKGPMGRYDPTNYYYWGIWNFSKNVPAAKNLLTYISSRENQEKLVAASSGFDTPPWTSFMDFKVWEQVEPPKYTVYNYPPRGEVVMVIPYSPAPARIANQIYAQATATKMIAQCTAQGKTIDQAIDCMNRALTA